MKTGSSSIFTYQDFHPYLWGPWFASIIPVFPISWLAESFVNDDLEIKIRVDEKAVKKQKNNSFSITYKDGSKKNIIPSSIKITPYETIIRFPVDSDPLDNFIFHIKILNKTLQIPFSKTSR